VLCVYTMHKCEVCGNGTRDGKEELGIYYYKIFILLVKSYSIPEDIRSEVWNFLLVESC
jgi:hypothetical protein